MMNIFKQKVQRGNCVGLLYVLIVKLYKKYYLCGIVNFILLMGWFSVQYALCKRSVLQLEVKNIYTGTGAYAVIFIEIFFNDEWELLECCWME